MQSRLIGKEFGKLKGCSRLAGAQNRYFQHHQQTGDDFKKSPNIATTAIERPEHIPRHLCYMSNSVNCLHRETNTTICLIGNTMSIYSNRLFVDKHAVSSESQFLHSIRTL